jgi:hypothetical protein
MRDLLLSRTDRRAEVDWHALPDFIQSLHPEAVRAVLGYGSWFAPDIRKPISFPDLYLIVDDYDRFYASRLHRWLNRVLPPNVYFVWQWGDAHRRIRGKYNVISCSDVERECGAEPRDVYNAGRLTKLVWIAWVRDPATRDWLITRLIDANRTLTTLALALVPERFSREDFSLELLATSYRAEARLEGWERIRAMHAAHAPFYAEMHALLLDAFAASTGLIAREPVGFRKVPHPVWRKLEARAARLLRVSRLRGYLRWARIVLTERNLADLAANEAERKAGVQIRLTPALRRHPLLLGLPEFLRVLRERNTRERIANQGRAAHRDAGSAARRDMKRAPS